MKHLVDQLGNIIDRTPRVIRKRELTVKEDRILKKLKMQGERFTKGRLITSTLFESKKSGNTSLLMIMEGRHSMSVGNQVASWFDGFTGVKSIKAVKTEKGACVILRLENEAIN